ncbi:hypothetical protein L493_4291 [Bordetella bronchiseptica 99-R-0433]|nr:hypothetical protein L493_4291 [Bordetella bronchiseptica 99-R-0433]
MAIFRLLKRYSARRREAGRDPSWTIIGPIRTLSYVACYCSRKRACPRIQSRS